MVPPNPKPQPKRPRWHLLYFALAAFDLLTISASLFLNHSLMNIYSESIDVNEQWAERLAEYSALSPMATDVNMPGNEVFDTLDIKGELSERDTNLASFNESLQLAKQELSAAVESGRVTETDAKPLFEQVAKVRVAMDAMTAVQDEIFQHFRDDEGNKAGSKMATMDRKNADLAAAILSMGGAVQEIQREHFAEQEAIAQNLRRFEYMIAGFIVLMVGAVTVYGHKIAQQVKKSDEALNDALAEAEGMTYELTALRQSMDKHTLFSIADRSGKIIDVNEGFCQISGFTREELLGQDHRMLNSGHHPKSFWKDMWRTLQSGQPWRAEVCNRAKDGSLYWVDSTNIPQFGPDGKISQYISLRFEVTEKMEAQRQLELAIEQAEHANKAKSDFLANMSHEIRTPMTAILGYSDLLNGDMEGDTIQVGNAINAIQSNASHLLTIINDILDVSKIEAGQMTVESIDTNPIQIVEEVASLVRPRAIGKGVHVNVRYDSEIPCHITSDPTRLKQILLNLAGNAIKFTEVGSVNIHLACDPKQEQLKLSVIDTGMGMTPEQRDAIAKFEAFSQADASTTRKFGGTGLGLRISNALAHLLGGGIEVESEQGTGSAFHVTISTGDLSNTEMLDPDRVQSIQTIKRAKPAEETLATASVDALKGVQILLAEDGPDNQRLIKHHLTKAGAEVTVCENGLVAVQAIEGASKHDLPHVILMDMQMPELDGYSATRQLRDKGINLPVIALTAHAMEGDRRKCLDAGCDDYLTKPIDKYTLISTCAKWVEKPQGKSSAA